MVAKVEII